jgi:hypothetical protein
MASDAWKYGVGGGLMGLGNILAGQQVQANNPMIMAGLKMKQEEKTQAETKKKLDELFAAGTYTPEQKAFGYANPEQFTKIAGEQLFESPEDDKKFFAYDNKMKTDVRVTEEQWQKDPTRYERKAPPTGGDLKNPIQVMDTRTGKKRFAWPNEIQAANGALVPIDRGMKISANPETGAFEISMGGAGGQSAQVPFEGLTTKAKGQVEGELLDLGTDWIQVKGIQEAFQQFPEALTWKGEWQAKVKQIKAKAQGLPGVADLTEEDRALIDNYTNLTSKAGRFFADMIKRYAGTAMTPQEAKRQEVWIPNPDDDPVTFERKLKNITKTMKLVTMRYEHIRANGLALESIPLQGKDGILGVVDKRGDLLEAMIREERPDLDEDMLRSMVKAQLRQEFGLASIGLGMP